MKRFALAILTITALLLSSCGPRRVAVVRPDPFQRLIGTSINDYLVRNQPPTQITDGTEGLKIYAWQWSVEYSQTSNNPGTRVNIGSRAKPDYRVFGGGSNTTTRIVTYWLNLSAMNGQIVSYAHKLPKDFQVR